MVGAKVLQSVCNISIFVNQKKKKNRKGKRENKTNSYIWFEYLFNHLFTLQTLFFTIKLMKLFITSSPNTFTILTALQVLYKNNGSPRWWEAIEMTVMICIPSIRNIISQCLLVTECLHDYLNCMNEWTFPYVVLDVDNKLLSLAAISCTFFHSQTTHMQLCFVFCITPKNVQILPCNTKFFFWLVWLHKGEYLRFIGVFDRISDDCHIYSSIIYSIWQIPL